MTTTSMCRRSCAGKGLSLLASARQTGRGRMSGPTGRCGFSDTGYVSVRIRRVTTTRAGGVSVGPFDTFNLGDHFVDDTAAVAADCVPVLLADARAGVAAAVHAGRVGAQRGVVARAVEAMLRLGAQAGDISALLGPAVSGRNYEVPSAMADSVEAALPGSRSTTP